MASESEVVGDDKLEKCRFVASSLAFVLQFDAVFGTPSRMFGDELIRKQSTSIGETLSQEPGLSSSFFGPIASRPVIRGQAGPRVLVLENGISSMDASDVSADHDVSIDPAHAEQIEILKGPATLIYGSSASAGAGSGP